MKRISLGVALMLVLAACATPATSDAPDETTTTSSPSADPTVGPVSPDPTEAKGPDPGRTSPVESAVVDLADPLGGLGSGAFVRTLEGFHLLVD